MPSLRVKPVHIYEITFGKTKSMVHYISEDLAWVIVTQYQHGQMDRQTDGQRDIHNQLASACIACYADML